jgi:hypothetical protein
MMLRLLVFGVGMFGAECQAPPTMLSLIREPMLVKAIHRRAAGQAKSVAADGASPLSAEWVAGKRKDWFIENQRGGSDLVDAGVALGDHKLVDTGLREFEWGYARQAKDGGFPETGDPFHSVSIFVLDSGRALIALRERRDEFPEFMARVDKLAAQLGAAANWMLQPAVLERGKHGDNPYTHRRWILAAALGEAALLTGNTRFAKSATEFAANGIKLQHEDGENPEKGGFDVSYQMVDALNGARYYTTLDCASQAELMARVRRMIEKTCHWEMQHISADGEIDVDGSTRMLKEKGRSGAIKHPNYKEIIQTFTYATAITGDKAYVDVAERLARAQGWLK